MRTALWFLLAAIALVMVVSAVWRLASRRRSLPCPAWLRWFVELDNPFARVCRAAVIVEHLDLRPGMTALDVGCGPGRVTIPLARKAGPQGQVIAADIQPAMLGRARQRAQAEGLNNIRFLHAAAGAGQLPPGAADRAVLVTVLGEIPDRLAALREIHGSLKPGGVLSITETVFDPHYQRRSTVTSLASQAGFREKAFFGNRMAYTLLFDRAE